MNKEEIMGKILFHIFIMTLLTLLTGLISYFIYNDLQYYLIDYWNYLKEDIPVYYSENDEKSNFWIMVPMMAAPMFYIFGYVIWKVNTIE